MEDIHLARLAQSDPLGFQYIVDPVTKIECDGKRSCKRKHSHYDQGQAMMAFSRLQGVRDRETLLKLDPCLGVKCPPEKQDDGCRSAVDEDI